MKMIRRELLITWRVEGGQKHLRPDGGVEDAHEPLLELVEDQLAAGVALLVLVVHVVVEVDLDEGDQQVADPARRVAPVPRPATQLKAGEKCV